MEKYKILFVCYGNICRSPMAEFILKDIVNKNNEQDKFYIESVATSREEIGSDMYYLAKNVLEKNQIPYSKRHARQITADDYNNFDYIFVMEKQNIIDIKKLLGQDKENKIKLLNNTIEDPWYSRDFDTCFSQIKQGCENIYSALSK